MSRRGMCMSAEHHAPGSVQAEPAVYEALSALSKRLDLSVLDWRAVNMPPGMVVFKRAVPEPFVVVVVADGWYAVQPAAGAEELQPLAPVGDPHLAAARLARAFGLAPQRTPGVETKIAVARVLDGTTCSYADCGLPAVASVAMAWDWIDFRCLKHWPETFAGLIRRGHELEDYR